MGRSTDEDDDTNNRFGYWLAGVVSGALSSVVCAPLDVARTRLQVYTTLGQQMSTRQVFATIINTEGAPGLFRGLGATLFTVPAFWGVYFPLYNESKVRYQTYGWSENMVHASAAVTAGLVSDVVCNPLFVVRTRLQTQALHNSSQQLSIAETAQSLYRQDGILTFYRGMTANIMGLSHVALQFPLYERFKQGLVKENETTLSTMSLVLASGSSKMIASVLTYPHEVLRSRIMDHRGTHVGLVGTAKAIVRQDGWMGLYAGLPVTLLRVIPNTCITLVTYERFVEWYSGA